MRISTATRVLLPVTVAVMGISLWINFQAPLEVFEGIVQKVMYVHVPSAWCAYLAFFVTFIASIGFLWRRTRAWDRVAVASAEIGVLFCTLTLITGPIWAGAVWGTWWTWDARLTSTLVLWFMYVGYLVVRLLAIDRSQGARWSAVVGIVAFPDVYIVHQSVKWWTGLHPAAKALTEGGLNRGLAPEMATALWTGVLAFTFLYLLLFSLRLDLEKLSDRVDAATEAI